MLLHNPCDIMTLRQGLYDITWSDIHIHVTLGRYITNHALWIYDKFSRRKTYMYM